MPIGWSRGGLRVRHGTVFTVTVRGRPVAQRGPPAASAPRTDVDRATIRRILASPIDGEELTADLDAAEALVDDPWSGG